MAIMMADLYSALKEAGASEDKAVKAAEESAGYESRLAGLESTLRLHTWILAANSTGILMLIGLALRGHS